MPLRMRGWTFSARSSAPERWEHCCIAGAVLADNEALINSRHVMCRYQLYNHRYLGLDPPQEGLHLLRRILESEECIRVLDRATLSLTPSQKLGGEKTRCDVPLRMN